MHKLSEMYSSLLNQSKTSKPLTETCSRFLTFPPLVLCLFSPFIAQPINSERKYVSTYGGLTMNLNCLLRPQLMAANPDGAARAKL